MPFALLTFIRTHWLGIVIIGAVLTLAASHFYAFRLGGRLKEAKIITKVVEAQNESKKEADHVRIEEQSLDDTELDDALCNLGIVRAGAGCR